MKTSLEQFICFGVKSDMPQKQIMAVYAGYSLIGTLLLLLPVSSKCDIPFIDHLFTVVSAISTTGLATVDVASAYTFLGQFVILLLIQMGGLGYMTLSSYVMLKLTGRFGSDKAKLFQIQFAVPDTFDSEVMLKSIVKYTFSFELLGFVLLCPYFLLQGTANGVCALCSLRVGVLYGRIQHLLRQFDAVSVGCVCQRRRRHAAGRACCGFADGAGNRIQLSGQAAAGRRHELRRGRPDRRASQREPFERAARRGAPSGL